MHCLIFIKLRPLVNGFFSYFFLFCAPAIVNIVLGPSGKPMRKSIRSVCREEMIMDGRENETKKNRRNAKVMRRSIVFFIILGVRDSSERKCIHEFFILYSWSWLSLSHYRFAYSSNILSHWHRLARARSSSKRERRCLKLVKLINFR